jgi:FAD synthetase
MIKVKKPIRVVASGVFDILHLGHLSYLSSAAKLGDELVVIIARNVTVKRRKGPPFNDEKTRQTIIDALSCVSKAVLGAVGVGDHLKTIERLKPDIIALGYDQEIDPKQLQQRIEEETGLKIKVVRVPKFQGSFSKTQLIYKHIFTYYQGKNGNKN